MEHSGMPFRITYVTDGSAWFSDSRLITSIDRCGFFLCTAGSASVTMADAPYAVKPGDVMIYTPSTIVRMVSQSADICGYLIEVAVNFMLPAFQKVMDVSHILYIREHPLLRLSAEDSAGFGRYMERLGCVQPCDEDPALGKIATEIAKTKVLTLIYELLLRYFRHHPIAPSASGHRNMVMQTFVVDLFRYYRTEREVAFYAGLQSMTPRYFSSIIKEQSGRPASVWINNLVTSQIRQMLDDSALSIKEVAAMFSFPSQSFFGKYFKLHTGMSPREYRRSIPTGR